MISKTQTQSWSFGLLDMEYLKASANKPGLYLQGNVVYLKAWGGTQPKLTAFH